jgi:superfamily II DNA or RNA helicase
MLLKTIYERKIYERFQGLIIHDNTTLHKIFEYYVCIQLFIEFNKEFYEYSDINPNFKELNGMSINDTGIDCCDLLDTIVQCKLRKKYINYRNTATFFGSQVIYNKETKETEIKWKNLILARNSDSILSKNLKFKEGVYVDKLYNTSDLIEYCKNIVISDIPIEEEPFILRDYQIEAINLIKDNNQNVIINLPTGTGKNAVIIYSMEKDKKYLILVPTIILLYQIKKAIKDHLPTEKIQKYGDNNKKSFSNEKNITICIYNSISLLKEHFDKFDKIYIDEGHHIQKPEIYKIQDDEERDEEEIDEETDEEEIEEDLNYIQTIQKLSQYNNNILLSATIDKKENYLYYSKDIREMINFGYLSDYNIHVPIFQNDPTNKNICEYLIYNYVFLIIYSNSQKEGKKLCKLMNEIQPNCAKYIDCKTKKIERKKILEDYENGNIKFLVNIRVLTEGFNSPKTQGVVFINLPSNGNTCIQIIGRCLRKYPFKNIATVILPYSKEDDGKTINKFLKTIALNDKRIRKSYEEKNTCGYINFKKIIEDEEDEEEEQELELKYDMIYNSLGKLLNSEEIWYKKLEELEKYCIEFEKFPLATDKDPKYKKLGIFTSNTKKNIKNNTISEERLEKINNIYLMKKWILENKDIKKIEFVNFDKNVEEVYNYSIIHKKLPPQNYQNIGIFVKYTKENIKNNKLSDKKLEKIKKIFPFNEWILQNMDIKKKVFDWDEMFEKLSIKIKDIDIFDIHLLDDDIILKKWVENQDSLYINNKLSDDRKIKFISNEKIKLYVERKRRIITKYDFNIYSEKFDKYYNITTSKNKLPSKNTKNIEDKDLSNWFELYRKKFKDGKLSKIELDFFMKYPGFIKWSQTIKKMNDFDIIFGELMKDLEFKDKLPEKRNSKYGSWLTHCKNKYTKGTLDQDKINKLMNYIPFRIWTGK